MTPIYQASEYHEIAVGDGVMRVDEGAVVVRDDDGSIAVLPPGSVDIADLPQSADASPLNQPQGG